MKLNAAAAVSVRVAALVMVGFWLTVKVNAWLVLPVVLVATKLIE